VKSICSVCECDPCDCGWGTYELENGKPNRIHLTEKYWWDYDGSDSESTVSTNWGIDYDSMEYPQSLQGVGGFARTYYGQMVLEFKVGEIVKYFPNCNLANDLGVWLVKEIVNQSPVECSWYDYEITNGIKSVLCRQEELIAIGE